MRQSKRVRRTLGISLVTAALIGGTALASSYWVEAWSPTDNQYMEIWAGGFPAGALVMIFDVDPRGPAYGFHSHGHYTANEYGEVFVPSFHTAQCNKVVQFYSCNLSAWNCHNWTGLPSQAQYVSEASNPWVNCD